MRPCKTCKGTGKTLTEAGQRHRLDARAIANGKCRECRKRKIAKFSKSRCALCLKNRRVAEGYGPRNAKGFGGRPRTRETEKTCGKCQGRKFVKTNAEHDRDREQRLRAQGLCARCGKLPIASSSKSRCVECLAYTAAREREKRAKP